LLPPPSSQHANPLSISRPVSRYPILSTSRKRCRTTHRC
jgi:hypothetical protein